MELLTISQFAEKVGVTPQAVYKRLDKDLAPYLVVENGVKLVKPEALELYKPNQTTKREKELQERLDELVQENQKLNERLTELNKEKVALLQEIAGYTTKLFEIVEQQTQQQENFQVLMAKQQQLNASLMQPKTTVEEPVEELKAVDLNDKKPSFISRLFKK
jgi:ribosomal protein S17E